MWGNYWRKRAEAAEDALVKATAAFDSLDKQMQSRATLVSMSPNGRKIRLLFIRNGELTIIDAYATMEADWNALERKLLG